jgi:hypothetical protein
VVIGFLPGALDGREGDVSVNITPESASRLRRTSLRDQRHLITADTRS